MCEVSVDFSLLLGVMSSTSANTAVPLSGPLNFCSLLRHSKVSILFPEHSEPWARKDLKLQENQKNWSEAGSNKNGLKEHRTPEQGFASACFHGHNQTGNREQFCKSISMLLMFSPDIPLLGLQLKSTTLYGLFNPISVHSEAHSILHSILHLVKRRPVHPVWELKGLLFSEHAGNISEGLDLFCELSTEHPWIMGSLFKNHLCLSLK